MEAAGWLTIPDPLLDGAIGPALSRMEVRAEKWIAKNIPADSEEVDLALAVLPGAEVVAFAFLGPKGAEPQPAVTAPAAPAPAAPAPAQSPAPATPPAPVEGARQYALG
jgi:hypothetical protein